MSVRMRKLGVLAVLTVGTVFAAPGCFNFLTYGLVQAVDFCNILNCNSGTFFNFCGGPLLADCPSTTTGTTTGA